MRLSDSGRRHRARPMHESPWCFKVIFNGESWVSKKQLDRSGREASTKDLVCSSVNFKLVGQIYQPFTVFGDTLNKCFVFVLVISTQVCENDSSCSTFYEIFT